MFVLVVISCITYLVVIFGGQYLLRSASAFKFKLLFQIHNLLLTVVSLSLLILLIEQLLPIIVRHGPLYAICSTEGWTQHLELLYYLNYLVKYWELADTVFLVVKKKKLGTIHLRYILIHLIPLSNDLVFIEFLHYFHHSMTMGKLHAAPRRRRPPFLLRCKPTPPFFTLMLTNSIVPFHSFVLHSTCW